MILFLSLFFTTQFSQAQISGCVFLEGLNLPCFGGGVACGSCPQQYSQEEMANACAGTLPLDNPPGCAQGVTCGQACCDSCSNYDLDDYYTCETVATTCGEVCGQGTKVASCDDPECTERRAGSCGTVTCRCGLQCEGTKPITGDPNMQCVSWASSSVPSGGTCGCPNIGASPGICSGSPTGAGECGGTPNPCTSSQEATCLGQSNECYVCSYQPGNEGTPTPTCSPGGSTPCFTGESSPVTAVLSQCSYTCPSGSTQDTTNPPGPLCSGVPGPVCTTDSQCASACSP